jgi:hypothetical protein
MVGGTGLAVTEFGFGAASLGNLYRAVDDETAARAVAAAFDAGIRYFDTAPHYGLGLSERRLGRALAGRDRGDFVISTKVGRLLEPNPSPSGSGTKQQEIGQNRRGHNAAAGPGAGRRVGGVAITPPPSRPSDVAKPETDIKPSERISTAGRPASSPG